MVVGFADGSIGLSGVADMRGSAAGTIQDIDGVVHTGDHTATGYRLDGVEQEHRSALPLLQKIVQSSSTDFSHLVHRSTHYLRKQ